MANNRIGDNIIIRYQDYKELKALVERQRVIIEMFVKATKPIYFFGDRFYFDMTAITQAREAVKEL